MYTIIWVYQVKPEQISNFEKIYASDGEWAHLFGKSEGYLGTEFLRDEADTHSLITIDRWASIQSFVDFKAKWLTEYEALDAQCKDMTEHKVLIGRYILPA